MIRLVRITGFLLIGVGLWAFYELHPPLAAFERPDRVFARFILDHMPIAGRFEPVAQPQPPPLAGQVGEDLDDPIGVGQARRAHAKRSEGALGFPLRLKHGDQAVEDSIVAVLPVGSHTIDRDNLWFAAIGDRHHDQRLPIESFGEGGLPLDHPRPDEVDLACLPSGIQNVLIPANATAEDVGFMLHHSGVRTVVVTAVSTAPTTSGSKPNSRKGTWLGSPCRRNVLKSRV